MSYIFLYSNRIITCLKYFISYIPYTYRFHLWSLPGRRLKRTWVTTQKISMATSKCLGEKKGQTPQVDETSWNLSRRRYPIDICRCWTWKVGRVRKSGGVSCNVFKNLWFLRRAKSSKVWQTKAITSSEEYDSFLQLMFNEVGWLSSIHGADV